MINIGVINSRHTKTYGVTKDTQKLMVSQKIMDCHENL